MIGFLQSKTLGVGPETSTGDIARLALDESRVSEWGYTLWARDRESAPCALIGCERPHSIQLARLRQSLSAEEGFDLTHCNNNNRVPCDIVFELKPNCRPSPKKWVFVPYLGNYFRTWIFFDRISKLFFCLKFLLVEMQLLHWNTYSIELSAEELSRNTLKEHTLYHINLLLHHTYNTGQVVKFWDE